MPFTEAEFADVIGAAAELTNQCGQVAAAYSLFASRLGDDKKHPHATLLHLELIARLHLASGTTLLKDPWLSYGVDSHIRPLLQVYAQVAYIMSAYRALPGTSHRGRALCVELNAAHREYREATRYYQKKLASHVKQIYEAIQALHYEEPCTCGGQGYVVPTERDLRELAQVGAPGWLPGAWSRASRALHASRSEQMKRFDQGEGIFQAATYTQRAVSFRMLVELYASIIAWALRNYDEPTVRAIMSEYGILLSRGPIVEGLAGGWDPFQ